MVFSYQTVESMRNGMSPSDAARDSILRIMKHYQNFVGAILAVDKLGNHGNPSLAHLQNFKLKLFLNQIGAACHGLAKFPYSYRDSSSTEAKIVEVFCL